VAFLARKPSTVRRRTGTVRAIMGLRDILSRSVEESLPHRKRSTMKDRYYQSGYASAKQGRHAVAGGLGSKNIDGDCGVDHRPHGVAMDS
jgi:hypothetical protein